MATREILIKLREKYQAFLNFYTRLYPIFAKGKIRQYGMARAFAYSFLLRIGVLIFRMLCLSAPPKYIFQGLRHVNLIKILPPSDVMVIGGRNEYIYCKKMGFRFHWAGYIGKSFELFYFAGKIGALSDAISLVQKYFTPYRDEKKYILLWEDTQPIGLVLSLSLRDIVGVNVICIAHGYDYAPSEKRMCIDGLNCKFNFVYDAVQAKLFNLSTTFILGLPYEIKPARTIKTKIFLVEHTGIAAGAEYIISTYHFLRLYGILERAGYDVTYRARPGYDNTYARSMFSDVCDGDKLDLFAEGRMIFIGFSSTLLYEAKIFGNIVVGLDTLEFFDQRNFDVDVVISAEKYNDLPSHLSTLISQKSTHPIDVESLYSRFFSCIKLIDSYNMNHG